MSIKKRIIVAFCIIVLLPIALTIGIFIGYSQIHVLSAQNKQNGTQYQYNMLSQSLENVVRSADTEYQELAMLARRSSKKLTDPVYLDDLNEKLKQKSAFLILREDQKLLYQGDKGIEDISAKIWLSSLPEYGSSYAGDAHGNYYCENPEALMKQLDFVTENGGKCSAFVVATTESIQPQLRRTFIDIIIIIVLALFATAMILLTWLYRGTMAPLQKLDVATKKIKEGNLDFVIADKYKDNDEMGELFRNFDEMRQKLKESTEEKMRTEKENRILISNIAHDLKTPITAIKGYAEGILDGVANTNEKKDRYVQTIYNKANEMDLLINELTLYSKIDTDRIPYNFHRLNVVGYFEDCIDEIGLQMEAENVVLTYENSVDPDTCIIADPEQLMRVMNNLLSNSIKYMDKPERKITIRVKDVGDFVQIEEEDNGKGISSKDLPYIFDRFYRADSSRNSSTGGSGIGLSIVKKIVEDHGGKIWATSSEQKGTTMYMVIRKYQEVTNE